MGHREVYGVLHDLMISYFDKEFQMLELGCGDASFTAPALLNTTITSYKGIDLSEVALEIARSNMEVIQCEKTFINGDIYELIPQLVKSKEYRFDAIFTSFALHHLTLEKKDDIIGQLRHLLKDRGIFILIDVMRPEEESREAYVRRYIENISRDWKTLTPQEFTDVAEHISSKDLPETRSIFYEIAQKYQFSRWDCLYGDPLDTTQLLCFYR
ncbi:MAG TPA: ubiquinone biosynthesis protein UbiE [Cyanobacteria bacterium UBA11166]|nr:ubiquinone biosynthesis protein UbiE [Cyanobacteria bacterium UBA11166]